MGARLRSIWDRSTFLAKSDWGYVAGAMGLVLGLAPLVPGWPAWASVAIAAAGIILSAVVFAYDTRALSRRVSGYTLTPVDPMFAELPQDVDLVPTHDPRGVTYGSDTIDRMLASRGGDITIRLREDPYRLPQDLAAMAPYVLSKTTGSKWPFNGVSARLATDIDPDAPERDLYLQPVSYFDFLCSNELMKWRVAHGDEHRDPRLDYMVDSSGYLTRLSESQLANVIGVSTVAITSDQQVLIVHQSGGNSASQGLWAPSGSGSLEPRDCHGHASLLGAVTSGVVRELIEETAVSRDVIGETVLTGYARWMRRGAKPEFFAKTTLTATAAEVTASTGRISSSEKIFTSGTRWVQLSDALAAVGDDAGTLTPAQLEIRQCASLPLVLALRKLAAIEASEPDQLDAQSR